MSGWLLVPLLATFGDAGASPAPDGNPTWEHASVPGFDIYSDVPTEAIGGLVRDLMTLHADLQAVWPMPQLASVEPMTVVFCNTQDEYAALCGALYPIAATPDGVDLVFDYPAHGGTPANPGWPYIVNYGGNMLQEAYARFFTDRLLGERVPPWLAQGLFKLIDGMCCRDGEVLFPALDTDPTLAIRGHARGRLADFQSAVADGSFFPLDALLSTLHPPPLTYPTRLILGGGSSAMPWRYRFGPDHRSFVWATLPFGPFIDESYEFAQYCLFARPDRYRAAFIAFAQAAANGPLDEAGFHRFFGQDYGAMSLELWSYAGAGRNQTFRTLPSSVPSIRFQPVDATAVVRVAFPWKGQMRTAPVFRPAR